MALMSFARASALMQRTKIFLRDRKTAYGLCFSSPAGQLVLADLVKFCRGLETTFNKDPHVQAHLEGRREVLLRIAQHRNMTVDQLFALYNGTAPTPKPDAVKEDEDD